MTKPPPWKNTNSGRLSSSNGRYSRASNSPAAAATRKLRTSIIGSPGIAGSRLSQNCRYCAASSWLKSGAGSSLNCWSTAAICLSSGMGISFYIGHLKLGIGFFQDALHPPFQRRFETLVGEDPEAFLRDGGEHLRRQLTWRHALANAAVEQFAERRTGRIHHLIRSHDFTGHRPGAHHANRYRRTEHAQFVMQGFRERDYCLFGDVVRRH